MPIVGGATSRGRRVVFGGGEGAPDVEVEVATRRCSCAVASCWHLGVVRELVDKVGQEFQYLATSALHKEVRRGDLVRAAQWGRVKAAYGGASKVKAYVSNIVLEETRNFDLMLRYAKQGGHDPHQVLAAVVGSRKKWELPGRVEAFSAYVQAYANVFEKVQAKFTVAPQVLRDVLLNSESLLELYEHFWIVKLLQQPDLELVLWTALRDRSERCSDPIQAALGFKPYGGSCAGFYQAKMGCELVTGLYTPEMNAVDVLPAPILAPDVFSIPSMPSYVCDNHTRVGLKLLVPNLHRIEPGKPLPSGIDIRWSGLLRGVAWRYFAFAQFGMGYKDLAWERVSIPFTTWRYVDLVDRFFYPRLYRK